MSAKDVQDFRSAAINAGAGQRVNPGFFDSSTHLDADEIARAKAYRQDPNNLFANQAYKNTGQTGIMNFITRGGFFGNLLRGLGQKFGLGKKAGEATYDMSEFSDYGLGGTPPGTLDFDSNAKISDTSFKQKPTLAYDDYNFPGIGYQGVDPSSPEFGGLQQTTARPYNQMNHWNNEIANNPALKNAINNPQGITSIINSELQNNATFAGLTDFQKTMLDQRKNMLDALGAQGILDTITSDNDPNDPATIQDVNAYYNI